MNLIQQHAMLKAQINQYHSRNQAAPHELVQRLIGIEQQAQATLTPEELYQAVRASNSLQAQASQQLALHQSQREAAREHHRLDNMAESLMGKGYDASKVQLAAKGQRYAVKGAPFSANHARQQVMQMFKRIDPKITYEKVLKISDAMEDCVSKGVSPQQAMARLGYKGNQAKSLAGMAVQFGESGVAHAIALTEGKQEGDHFVQPHEDEQRRAQVVDAVVKHSTKDAALKSAINQKVHPSYYEETGNPLDSRADIARAFDLHESLEEGDTGNYQGERYNTNELMESDNVA